METNEWPDDEVTVPDATPYEPIIQRTVLTVEDRLGVTIAANLLRWTYPDVARRLDNMLES